MIDVDYCWCGRPAAVRCNDLALFVEAPEGFDLCRIHYMELIGERMDELIDKLDELDELIDEHNSELRQWAE